MNTESIIFYASWPILIYTSYRLAVWAIAAFEKKEETPIDLE